MQVSFYIFIKKKKKKKKEDKNTKFTLNMQLFKSKMQDGAAPKYILLSFLFQLCEFL